MYRRQSPTTKKKHFKRSEESFSFAILSTDRDRQKQEIMKHDDVPRWQTINETIFQSIFEDYIIHMVVSSRTGQTQQLIKLNKWVFFYCFSEIRRS